MRFFSRPIAVFALVSLAACGGGGGANSALPATGVPRSTDSAVQSTAVAPASASLTPAEAQAFAGVTFNANAFDSYNTGPVVGQRGWLGSPCGYSASHIDATSLYPAAHFAGRKPPSNVLVVGNTADDGCFDGLGSPPTANAAGRPDSFTVADPTWTPCGKSCRPIFVAEWTITSSTGGYQPGVAMSVSPVYNNDGARMAYVGMEFVPNPRTNKPSLHIFTFDVQGVCPPNTTATCGNPGPAPCFQCANFVQHDVAYVDPSAEHTIGIVMEFLTPRDRVLVTVDGIPAWVGGSWQDYYTMDTESDPGGTHPHSRAVNDLLLHSNGTSGSGFLYRNAAAVTL
jgi:hypothetical protein